MSQTLAEKVWERHVVHRADGEPDLLYVDLHLVHEVTSPQAFDGLRLHGRPVRRPDLTVATMDHNVPTTIGPVTDEISKRQMDALSANAAEFGITLFPMGSPGQGIVHVIGPEQGYTQPGLVIVCGDSHTSTHGAFGALAFGIGTSEVEHVPRHPDAPADEAENHVRHRRRRAAGRRRGEGHHPGDHRAHRHERRRRPHRRVPRLRDPRALDGRPDDDLQHVDRGRRARGHGRARRHDVRLRRGSAPRAHGADWERALDDWRALPTDPDATFDREVRSMPRSFVRTSHGARTRARVSRSTRPCPIPVDRRRWPARGGRPRADLHGLAPGTPIRDIRPDTVFIGSCTNSRIEDLRLAASVVEGRRVAAGLRALVVPGSFAVKEQAESEGLDRIFSDAGFDWRGAGCSMCLGMNPDILQPGERSASTSNRNFEGRQGKGGRTHLVSPAVAAATAIAGHFCTPEDL